MSPNFSQVFGTVSPSLTDPCVPEVARRKQHSRLVSGTEASHEEGWNGMEQEKGTQWSASHGMALYSSKRISTRSNSRSQLNCSPSSVEPCLGKECVSFNFQGETV